MSISHSRGSRQPITGLPENMWDHVIGGGMWLPGPMVHMAACWGWGNEDNFCQKLWVGHPSLLILGRACPYATCAFKPGYCKKVVFETPLPFKEERWFSINIRSRFFYFFLIFFASYRQKHTKDRKAVSGGKAQYSKLYAVHQVTVLLFLGCFFLRQTFITVPDVANAC